MIDQQNKKLEFAGANNPLLMIRNNELTQIKGDKMPIGIHQRDNVPFTNHEIEICEGDTLYMFSDGYVDQFGGERGRKFMIKRFKEMLVENVELTMHRQYDMLNKELDSWMNQNNKKYEQIDDILVIGVRV